MLPFNDDDQVENAGTNRGGVAEIRLNVSSATSPTKHPTFQAKTPPTPNVGAKFDTNLASIYDGSRAAYEEESEPNIFTDKNLQGLGNHGSSRRSASVKKFGTIFGVFLPCLQNILGVILFLRLPWIVAQAGVLGTSGIILICVLSTALTTLSMSALATNGRIPAGGPYAIVTLNLGSEIGGAVGVLFYLGTTLAATLYILGGVEAVYTIFLSDDSLCGNTTSPCATTTELFPFDREVIGFSSGCVLGLMVVVGMQFVSKISLVFLMFVLMAIVFMLLGVILFSAGVFEPEDMSIKHGQLSDNLFPNYQVDVDTGVLYDFTALIALFFPSVTGIMAGSNRSGLLADPSRSIPKGTLSAVVLTTCFYLLTVWIFGSTIANSTLQANKLIASSIAWPNNIAVAIGIIMSCVGAALQCLTGAPQLLKSIANDRHLPFLKCFATSTPEAEPKLAVLATTMIASLCCLAGNLDYITPIITMFFLSMYAAINISCFFSSYIKSPGFRPKWRFYHWTTALTGFLSCVITMFIISTLYTFIAIFFVISLCCYIYRVRETREWGNAVVGLRLEQATSNLIALSDFTYRKRSKIAGMFLSKRSNPSFHGNGGKAEDGHLKGVNWRPQVLVFIKLNENVDGVVKPELLRLASHLKKGRGLTVAQSIIHGDVMDENAGEQIQRAKLALKRALYENRVKGFAEVICSPKPFLESFKVLLQSAGLGPLRTNTVLFSWPDKWSGADADVETPEEHKEVYVNILKSTLGSGHALVVQKFLAEYPYNENRVKGTIDVWWLIHDGGILVLLPYLMKRHRVWRECRLRLFAIAPKTFVDKAGTERRLKSFVESLRIEAEIHVIPVNVSDVRDIDENRTVVIKNGFKTPSGHASVLNAEIFAPPTETEQNQEGHHNSTRKLFKKMSSFVRERKDSDAEKPEVESIEELRRRLAPAARALEQQGVTSSTREWFDNFASRRSLSSVFELSEYPSPIQETDESGGEQKDGQCRDESPKAREQKRTMSEEMAKLESRLLTAGRLNELFCSHSSEAELVVLNLPLSRKTPTEEFIKYTETLTSKLPKVIMIRGNGNEHVHSFS